MGIDTKQAIRETIGQISGSRGVPTTYRRREVPPLIAESKITPPEEKIETRLLPAPVIIPDRKKREPINLPAIPPQAPTFGEVSTGGGGVTVEQQLQGVQRGTLRPEFIIPSDEIFEPTRSEQLQSQIDLAKFDFVKPYSIGGLNDDKRNPMTKMNDMEDYIRYLGWREITDRIERGALGYLNRYKRAYDMLPRQQLMRSQEAEFTQVGPFAEYESPYNKFSQAIDLSNEAVNNSVLYGIVP